MTDARDVSELPSHTVPPPNEVKVVVSDNRWSYEMTVAEVEAIIDQIESGNLELADVFTQFARAVEQLRQCETFLNQQQQRMDLLIETLLDDADPF